MARGKSPTAPGPPPPCSITRSALHAIRPGVHAPRAVLCPYCTSAATFSSVSFGIGYCVNTLNFKLMPELEWEYGYPWALGMMATLGLLLALLFRRIGWL